MADLCLVPQCYNASRFGVELAKVWFNSCSYIFTFHLYAMCCPAQFPTIMRIHDTLKELDAFKKADYAVQPDCPPELRA